MLPNSLATDGQLKVCVAGSHSPTQLASCGAKTTMPLGVRAPPANFPPPPMADALAVAATVDGPTASRQRAPRQRARRAYVLVATMMAVVAACALLSYSMYPSAAAWSVDMTSQAEMDEQVGPQASRCPTCLPHPIVEWWTEALLQRMCTCKGRAPLPAY